MNNIKRKGVDINASFLLASKRMQYKTKLIKKIGIREDAASSRGIRNLIKGAMRKIFRYGFRLARPLARPLITRLRQYFVGGLIEENHNTNIQLQSIKKSVTALIENNAALYQNITSLKETIERQHFESDSRFNRIEEYSFTSARRLAISCGPSETMIKTEVGYVLCPSTDHALIACLLEAGELESGIRTLIQRLIKPGSIYVEVGANIGMHSLAAAQAMQGHGKIIAFEPCETTKRLLEKTMRMNGHSNITEIYNTAVNLNLGVDQKIDLMKIDAEGAEINVIEGAVALINNNPDISLIVEFGHSHLKSSGSTVDTWLATFTKLDLNYRVINAVTGTLEEWTTENLKAATSISLLLSRNRTVIGTGQQHEI